MATNWPNSVQTFTNPTAGSALNSPSHADQHATVNDTVEALQNYAGLVLVSSTAVGSGVSSVDVNDVYSSTFDNYKITYTNYASSITNIGMRMRLKTGTVDTSSNYYWGGYFVRYTSTGSGFDRSGGALNFFDMGSATSPASALSWEMYSPNLSAYTLYSLQQTAASSTDQYLIARSGVFRNTTQFSGFQLFPASGTITGGTIRVYGYNNG
jgi:hypothetical protein